MPDLERCFSGGNEIQNPSDRLETTADYENIEVVTLDDSPRS